jgi:2-oxoisovalerate dehydrogenase E1 component
MNTALQGTDPVIFFESQRIYDIGEMFHPGGVPEKYYEIPFGEPDIKREGHDITLLSVGATLYTVLKVADILQDKYGLSSEVIDARSLVPFNYEPVIQSVKKTGRILLASDASSRGSFLKEMAQTITELAFDFFPQPYWILDAIHERILPLKGHINKTDFSINKSIALNKEGV